MRREEQDAYRTRLETILCMFKFMERKGTDIHDAETIRQTATLLLDIVNHNNIDIPIDNSMKRLDRKVLEFFKRRFDC